MTRSPRAGAIRRWAATSSRRSASRSSGRRRSSRASSSTASAAKAAYLSPEGTPYAARGIPPESLNPFPGGEPCNYYRYRVLKPFAVNAGPIAPALGQPRFGLQYVFSGALFAGVTERVNVSYLLSNGYVERVPYAPPKPVPAPVPAA